MKTFLKVTGIFIIHLIVLGFIHNFIFPILNIVDMLPDEFLAFYIVFFYVGVISIFKRGKLLAKAK